MIGQGIITETSTTQIPISYGAAGAGATNVTSVDIPKPAGVVSGDLLIIRVGTNGATITPPAGWVRQTTDFTASFTLCEVHTRVADGSEGSTFTFTTDAGATVTGICESFKSVNATPMDATATHTTGTAATLTFPDITTVTNNAWHYAAAFEQDATGDFLSTPGGYAARAEYHAGVIATRSFTKAISPAALVTAITSSDSAGAPKWVAVSLALKPS